MNPIPTELLEAQSIAIDTLTRLMQGRPLAADDPSPSNHDAALETALSPEDHKRRETARRSATDLLRIITRFHLAKPHNSNRQRTNHSAHPNALDADDADIDLHHNPDIDLHHNPDSNHTNHNTTQPQRSRSSNPQRKTERPPPRPFSVPLPSPWPADLSSLERSPIPLAKIP